MGSPSYHSVLTNLILANMSSFPTFLLLVSVLVAQVLAQEPQIPDYCTKEIPVMMQNCNSNRDCLEGLTCIKDQGHPFCFNHNIYFQIGCPCESHDDCPEACYGPLKGCGAWLV